MAPAVIENLLRTRPPGWFRDYDDAILRSLADALDEGQRMQGRNIKKWVYGRYFELLIAHPIGHRFPEWLRATMRWMYHDFDIGPVPMSGSSTSVKQTARKLGPSMRMNLDFGDWERSLMNLPIGESGHWLSRHYQDQWNAYYSATSFPMQFRKVESKNVLEFVPQ